MRRISSRSCTRTFASSAESGSSRSRTRGSIATADPQPELDVLPRRHVREEAVGLKDHPHVAPVGRRAGHVLAVDDDRAGVGPVKAGHEPQRGRLAAAGRPEQREELALLELEVDAVERHDRPEHPAHALELEKSHQRVAATCAGRPTLPRPTISSDSMAAHVIPKLISDTAAAGYACVSLMYWMYVGNVWNAERLAIVY